MKDEDVIEFLLSLAASACELEFRAWNSLLLEIFYLIFYSRAPKDFVAIGAVRNVLQKNKLQEMMEKDSMAKKLISTRHSRFGGTLTYKTSVFLYAH